MHLRATLALASLLAASAAHAESEADPTEHRHLGFYLRLDVGVGGQHTSLPGGDSSAGRSVGGTGVAIGGALSENLILAGHLWGVAQTGTNDPLQLTGLGPQLTAYYTPSNVYVSITPSLTVNNLHGVIRQLRYETAYDSMKGFGLFAALGKEWWVGAHWGLGVAGEGFVSWNRDTFLSWGDGNGDSATTWGGRVAFSATYN